MCRCHPARYNCENERDVQQVVATVNGHSTANTLAKDGHSTANTLVINRDNI
jgi:hypothetical protein